MTPVRSGAKSRLETGSWCQEYRLDDTTAGLVLGPTATQFVVLEAKMGSKLAAGTSKAPWFDQAARNVAAMAWTIHTAEVSVEQVESLGFFVFAPRYRIDEHASFAEYTTLHSIREKAARRVALYTDGPDTKERLAMFNEATMVAVLERIELGCHLLQTGAAPPPRPAG